MQWNNNQGGPWDQGPRTPQPPDIEQMLQQLKDRLNSGMPPRHTWVYLGLGILLLWLASGIYLVGPDEQGVVLRFGRFIQITEPGPHFRIPFPVEEVYKPKVTQVQRVEVGYRSRGRAQSDVQPESMMLTGDENIIDIDMSVQFQIKNAADFLFKVRNPPNDADKLVRDVAETAIRRVIGRNSIDEALTTGKDRIQSSTKLLMQEILDLYQAGIRIVAVQLQQVAPPDEVIHSFKDVASAREDRERSINESQGYANDILPKAKGEAARIIQEATAYKSAKLARARGDVERYLALMGEWSKQSPQARQVTGTRLYLETVEEVLQRAHKIIVDPKTAGNLLPYLPLDGTPQRTKAREESRPTEPGKSGSSTP